MLSFCGFLSKIRKRGCKRNFSVPVILFIITGFATVVSQIIDILAYWISAGLYYHMLKNQVILKTPLLFFYPLFPTKKACIKYTVHFQIMFKSSQGMYLKKNIKLLFCIYHSAKNLLICKKFSDTGI